MSIAFSKYIRIFSGVGAGAGVRTRDLILRLITPSAFVSPDAVLEFRSAADVGTYFGLSSEEYRRAVAYFGYVSPNISGAKLLSFSRWAEAGTSASIIGNNDPKTLAAVTAINAGAFTLQLGSAAPVNIAGVNLSGAASLAAAAALLQVAVRAADASLATATVAFAADGPSRFTVAVPATLGALIAASTVSGAQDIATVLGLKASVNGINITGVAAQTSLEAFNLGADVTDNFGSFVFLDDLDLSEAEELAAANLALNFKYMFLQRVEPDDAAAWSAALLAYGGTGLTLSTVGDDEFPEQLPGAILAATDYSKRNATQNYMYRQAAGLTPRVLTTALSDTYDALRVNYYGQTATAGQKINFYQRGTLMGTGTAATDMNVYANEMWLKDKAGAELMALQLGIGRVPANDSGRAMVANTLQPVIDQALENGTISIGKELTAQQKVFISQRTNDELAWHTVQDVGYILNVVIEPYVTTSGATEYKAVYDLIYAKDDAVRFIDGTHSLI